MIEHALLQRIGTFAGDPAATAVGAGLLVTECIDPALNLEKLVRSLDSLAAGNRGEEAPWKYLAAVGFRGAPDLDVVAGSRMDRVVDDRLGLPIALGSVLIHIAERQGSTAVGVNFPGHFLVRVDDTLVDPYLMVARSEAECLGGLPPSMRSDDPFEVASPQMILLRMLNNLKFHYLGRDEFHLALDMVDCQLRLLPGEPGLLLEKGECWLRMGSIEAARSAFLAAEVAAVSSGAVENLAAARRLLEALPGGSEQLH